MIGILDFAQTADTVPDQAIQNFLKIDAGHMKRWLKLPNIAPLRRSAKHERRIYLLWAY